MHSVVPIVLVVPDLETVMETIVQIDASWYTILDIASTFFLSHSHLKTKTNSHSLARPSIYFHSIPLGNLKLSCCLPPFGGQDFV